MVKCSSAHAVVTTRHRMPVVLHVQTCGIDATGGVGGFEAMLDAVPDIKRDGFCNKSILWFYGFG